MNYWSAPSDDDEVRDVALYLRHELDDFQLTAEQRAEVLRQLVLGETHGD